MLLQSTDLQQQIKKDEVYIMTEELKKSRKLKLNYYIIFLSGNLNVKIN